jgi:predicted nucleic acid-binding protein
MRVLFDTNVILDVLLERRPFSESASKLLSRVEKGEITGLVCATTITTIYYLVTSSPH